MPEQRCITVLIVEDNVEDRHLLRAYLEGDAHVSYQLREVTTAAEALVSALDSEPDCILVDFHLPDADGLDLIARLDRAGLIERCAVVMLSGQGDERICAAAMKKGALDYARKGDLTRTGLTSLIQYAVGRCERQRDTREKQAAIELHVRELAQTKATLEATITALERSNRELTRAQEAAHHELTHDPSTGLPNRRLLVQQIADSIHHAERYGRSVAALYIHVDSFSRISEALGTVATDDLLCGTSERLREAVRGTDVVARVGPHEFAILLRGLADPRDAALVARKLVDVISKPHSVIGGQIPSRWRAGVAIYPRDARDAETLLLRAHTAMCESSERDPTGLAFYDRELNAQAQSELALEGRLRAGIERGELALVYQPVLSLLDQSLVAIESLLRWRHPTRGWLDPEHFLRIAARSSLIVEIGDWVVRRGLEQLRDWQLQGLPPVPLAVNVSSRELRTGDFADRVGEHAFEVGIAPELIRCEFTESELTAQGSGAYEQLSQLRSMGVGISLDDFGMTHTSFETLDELPFDTVKLDRRFVTSAHRNRRNEAVVSAMLALAHGLSLDTVAVGVEEAASLALLKQHGCKHVQGYALSKPLPPGDFMAWASSSA